MSDPDSVPAAPTAYEEFVAMVRMWAFSEVRGLIGPAGATLDHAVAQAELLTMYTLSPFPGLTQDHLRTILHVDSPEA